MIHLRGLEIGDVLHRWIRPNKSKWRVELLASEAAVFSDGAGRCWALMSRQRQLDPVAGVVEPWPAVRAAFRIGSEVRGAAGVLTGGGLTVDFSGLPPWRSALPQRLTALVDETVLAAARRTMSAVNAGRLTKLVGRAMDAGHSDASGDSLSEDIRRLVALDPWPADGATPPVSLIGLGEGLTPEGDDLLAGWFAARHAFAACAGSSRSAWRRVSRDWVRRQTAGRTTAVSAQLLVLAAGGQLCQPAAQLLSVLGRNKCHGEVSRSMDALAGWGATSGRAVLAGITIILRHLILRNRGRLATARRGRAWTKY